MPIGGHGHVICMGNLGGVYSQENTPEGPTKVHFFHINKYLGEMVIMNDLEWIMFS